MLNKLIIFIDGNGNVVMATVRNQKKKKTIKKPKNNIRING